ncbi:DUF4347 domain-containing protein [Oceanimonas marisflavi]|uniref:DUF4347 domain-containing protein n=1 Tax=Oceanimonas marisflavi TaxID=2059724 RepID=UPI000D31053E|nr:DUF4347 domain-containing protein [Oceanimonas marisflavi]
MNKQDTPKTFPKFRRKPLITALESRILLDGAAVATAVEMTTDVDHQDTATHANAPEQTVHFTALAPTQVREADPAKNNGRKEVAFVDTGVEDYQTLVDGIGAGIEVRLIDGGQDGLAQLAVWAQQNEGYDAIHILSHGDEGQIRLGGLTLDTATVKARSADLAELGATLSEDGDILLYGCRVAANGAGVEFIQALSASSAADIAASSDLTGDGKQGGNWTLEQQTGPIEAVLPFSADALDAYTGLLLPILGSDGRYEISTENGWSTADGTSHSSNDFDLTSSDPIAVATNGEGFWFTSHEISGSKTMTLSAKPGAMTEFDLTGLNIYKWGGSSATANGQYAIQITGYKTEGGTVSTSGATSNGHYGWEAGREPSFASFTDITKIDITVTALDSPFYSLGFEYLNLASPESGAPEITVTGNGTDIADGDTTPSNTDHTDFGSTEVSSGSVSRTFTINNTGTAELALGSVVISGANAADFSVTSQPTTSIAAGGSTTFTVSFDPAAAGIRTAALSVSTNDSDENPFNFSISGTGTSNSAPVFSGLDGAATFTEGGSAVVIDGDVTVADTELDNANSYAGASVTLARQGGANGEDGFGNSGLLGTLIEGQVFTYKGTEAGTVTTHSNGTLKLTFNASATSAIVDSVLQSITYANSSNDPSSSVTLDWTFNDGTNNSTGTNQATVNITAINDEPALTANASNPTFTEDGSAASLFSGTSIDTVETDQNITGLSFTVSNVADGSHEVINFDGTVITLTHGTSGSTNSLSYSVSVSSGTATVNLTGGNLSADATEALIDSMSYQNNSNTPNTSNRVVTLTSIQDSGGTANGGDNTGSLALSSTVTVVDLPMVRDGLNDLTYTEGDGEVAIEGSVSIDGNANYSGGYIEFAIDEATSLESLGISTDEVASTADGAVSIVGSSVYLGDGTQATVIGSIDATHNGENGKSLRINFSNAFQNGDFQQGIDGADSFVGWTTGLERVRLDGTDQIAGQATPVDTTYPANNGSIGDNTSGGNFRQSVTLTDDYHSGGDDLAAVLDTGGASINESYGVIRGPYLYSNGSVSLQAGDSVSFDWKALDGGDAYDAYGYLLDVDTGNTITLLDQTGTKANQETAWSTETVTIQAGQEGTYRFVFVAGSYDLSGGRYLGGKLVIDNVDVTQANPMELGGDALSKISQRITYTNTAQDQVSASRTLTVSVQDANNESGEISSSIYLLGKNTSPEFSGNGTLTSINEDTSSPAGASVSDLFGTLFDDADSTYEPRDTLAGIVITADHSEAAEGQWQYSTDGGTNWEAVGEVSTEAGLLLSAETQLRFVPGANYHGTPGALSVHAVDSSDGNLEFSTTVSRQTFNTQADGGNSAVSVSSVQLNTVVISVNDAPVAVNDTATAVEAGGVSNGTAGNNASGNVLSNDTDVDSGDSKTVTGVVFGETAGMVGQELAGAYGKLILKYDGAYTYVIDESNAAVQALRTSGQTLSETFSYTVTDTGGLSDTATLTITLTGENDNPVANNDTAIAVEAGGEANGTAGSNASGNVLDNDTDVDSGDSKTVTGKALTGQYGSLTLNTDGSYSYVIDESNAAVQALRTSGQTLSETFSYTVTDAGGLTDTATLTITLKGENDNPVANNDTAIAVEAGGVANGTAGSSASGNVLDNDTDVDSGDSKTVTGKALTGQYGSLTLNSNGTYSYVIDESNAAVQALRTSGQTLSETFSYTVTDTGGLSDTATLTITIQGSNDNPVALAADIDEQWNFGKEYRRDISVLFTDMDSQAYGEDHDFVIKGLPKGLSYNPETGVISGKPVEAGKFIVTLTATDKAGASISRDYLLEILAPPKAEAAARPASQIDVPSFKVDNTQVVVELSSLPPGLVNQDTGQDPGDASGFVAPRAARETVLLSEPGALLVQTTGTDGRVTTRASVDVNVNDNGEVIFTEVQQQALDTVSLRVSRIVAISGNGIAIDIVDGKSGEGQRYSGALADGTELPGWISVDPQTGQVSLRSSGETGELTLRIQATGGDGQVRILEITLDLEKLQPAQGAGRPEGNTTSLPDTGFVPLSEQLATEVEAMEGYGDRLLNMLTTA